VDEAAHALDHLLQARSRDNRDAAWSVFLEQHSKLILDTARRTSSGHDDLMDRYTYVLGHLRQDDFRRLRSFSLNGTGKFTTWLVVVVRRLCIDHHRRVFGRPQDDSGRTTDPEFIARRNLAELLADGIDPDQIREEPALGPDADLIARERAEQLGAVLAELGTRDQLLLTLRYVDGHSPKKVADMLGFPSRFAVHRRLKSLVAALRRRLEDKGFER
jgi:RNA polymerase sigma factor (sigma-70 family)